MIVRNEAAVIGRCLRSVRELIDHWVICDTGSTDATPELIEQTLAGVPGELHRRPWMNFGHNRTELLSLAAGKADYLLLLDADWTFQAQPGALVDLTADAYLVRHEHPRSTGFELHTRNLVRGDRKWWYVGVAHEYLETDGERSELRLDGAVINNWADGGVGRAARWRQDAELLERELERDPDNARNVFYLAQTYSDLGETDHNQGDQERALELYRRRAAIGGWDQEVFYSLYQVGVLSERLGRRDAAIAAMFEAWSNRPQRAEPLYELARMFREREQHHAAYLVSARGIHLRIPDDILFVHRWMYEWGLLFEYSIAAYWAGQPQAALTACDRLLAMPDLPGVYRAQTQENRTYCVRAVGGERSALDLSLTSLRSTSSTRASGAS